MNVFTGELHYTPDADWYGVDQLSYSVGDSNGSGE